VFGFEKVTTSIPKTAITAIAANTHTIALAPTIDAHNQN
jgi:hypothetical protein